MARQLSHPAFQPLYEFERCIETIRGLNQLDADAYDVIAQYPYDEHHLTISGIAQQAIVAARNQETERATELRWAFRADETLDYDKVLDLSDLETIQKRIDERAEAIKDRQSGVDELLRSPMLVSASPEERELVKGIAERQVETAREAMNAESDEWDAEKEAIKHVKAIGKLTIPKPFRSPQISDLEQPVEESKEIRDANQRVLLERFDKVIKAVVEGSKGIGYIGEARLIAALFPDLYEKDRPAAYSAFDTLYQALYDIKPENSIHFTDILLQQGHIHPASHAGKPTGRPTGTVYRAGLLHDPAVNGKAHFNQRVKINEQRQVIVWGKGVPRVNIK